MLTIKTAMITFRAVDERDHLEEEATDLKSKVATLEKDAKDLRSREVADRDLEFELEQVHQFGLMAQPLFYIY